jgi:hypothetical protein
VTGELPDFTLRSYDRLLERLAEAGYALAPVSAMRTSAQGRVVYLRHDVDLHLAGVDAIARVESGRGVSATYYVPLAQPFNPAHGSNRAVLRELVAQGHEIGLHYDLSAYPDDVVAMEEQLRAERTWLETIVAAPVETVSTHEPHKRLPDPFLEQTDLLHPHAPAFADGVTYVSDSCRRWRDRTLLACFGDDGPDRVLLNTHPELWLADEPMAPGDFLTANVIPAALEPQRRWYDEVVRTAWADRGGDR